MPRRKIYVFFFLNIVFDVYSVSLLEQQSIELVYLIKAQCQFIRLKHSVSLLDQIIVLVYQIIAQCQFIRLNHRVSLLDQIHQQRPLLCWDWERGCQARLARSVETPVSLAITRLCQVRIRRVSLFLEFNVPSTAQGQPHIQNCFTTVQSTSHWVAGVSNSLLQRQKTSIHLSMHSNKYFSMSKTTFDFILQCLFIRNQDPEEISGSRESMHGYVLNYSRL